MWKALISAALLAQYASAQNMLRFACSQLVVERTDPIVNPGAIYTPHLHQIIGGNSFNITMDPNTHDLVKQSTCTTCTFKEDLSNYWTAVLMYKSKEGKYMRVPTTGNGGPQGRLDHGAGGGMDIYYMHTAQSLSKMTAFKPGFRMVAGDAGNRDASKVRKNALCHRCWTSSSEAQFVGGAPCSGTDTVEIPTGKNCKMIRQTLIFPSCWNGKDLDAPNHQDHMAYPSNYAGATGGGNCPSTHPIPTPQIMYEIMWNTTEFTTRSDWDASQPYVLSMGLGGSALHGDYVFGWKDDTLQKAMQANCNLNRSCAQAGITAQTPAEYMACKKAQQAPEPVDGFQDELRTKGMVQK